MDIEDQFNRISKEYDGDRAIFIPCFHDFYQETTAFIAANIAQPKRILDLGAGTGLLSYFWYQHFPKAEYLLVDIADEMLEVARERFSGSKNVNFEIADFSKAFPAGRSDCTISALSIHHLETGDKEKLFSRIYDGLSADGLFVNYDQFRGGTAEMDGWFDSYWIRHLETSELTEEKLALWRERRKLDRECSVEDEVDMLLRCGFKEVKCVYSNQKFSVVVAIK